MSELDLKALWVQLEAAEYCARQSGYGHADATVHLPPAVLRALLERMGRRPIMTMLAVQSMEQHHHDWLPWPGYRNSVPAGWLGFRCRVCLIAISRRAL